MAGATANEPAELNGGFVGLDHRAAGLVFEDDADAAQAAMVFLTPNFENDCHYCMAGSHVPRLLNKWQLLAPPARNLPVRVSARRCLEPNVRSRHFLACKLTDRKPPHVVIRRRPDERPKSTQLRHRSVCLVIEEADVRRCLCPTERSFIVRAPFAWAATSTPLPQFVARTSSR